MDKCDAAFGAFVAFAPPARQAVGGLLAGLSVAIKDNIAVEGLPYTAGVPLFESRVAASDAAVVTRLKAAGAAIAGVTRTDAGGLGVLGHDVVNPRTPAVIAGGSSGGSAAAVSAGLAGAALGTDTGGSVRIPAACCGVFGFKPTHGRIPAEGVWPLAETLEDVGVITASTQTLLITSGVLLGVRVATTQAMPILGFDRVRLAGCDERVRDSFERSLTRLARAGCSLRELRLPDRDAVCAAHSRIVLSEVQRVYAKPISEGNEAGLGSTIWRALQLGRNTSETLVAEAYALREDLVGAWPSLLRRVDCVILPTLPVPPPRQGVKRIVLGDRTLPAVTVMTAEASLANFIGTPAVAIPAREEASLQIVGRAGEDEELLGHAATVAAILRG